ncbi:ABC transporter permease [Sporosarcina aquimarina]|uniref:ABC transporter permease n=1 Tax=Sporosarcina aquimarina TaxID=114975 RepID=A0ABU4FZD0_9BACL|nr:ABC transporter permease [Sporosarcina aquimarina]MDW0108757.1 ABC transporter permease [Sporosarcina aquimarina]
MGKLFKKCGRLSVFILKRDAIRLVLWVVGIAAVTLSVPPAFQELYPAQEQRDAMAETMRNPAMTAMVGPGDLQHYSIGAMTSHQMILLTAVAVAIMNILLAVRFTRAEEEAGMTEMIRSRPVGRLASLASAVVVLLVVNVVLALVIWLGLFSLGIESIGMQGAFLYGAALGAVGLFFAGISVVSAQLAESARGATTLSMLVLVVTYFVRAAGDVADSGLSWLSPFGWVTKVQPFSVNNGWPIVLLVLSALVVLTVAAVLQSKRDVGAGFIPARPGRTRASASLTNPFGLVWRLQRTGTIIWAIGLVVLGISYGSVMGDLESFFDGNELLANMLAGDSNLSVAEQFLPMLMLVMAFIATIPSVLAVQKIVSEERNGRIDHVLGRRISRTKLVLSYIGFSVMVGIVMNSLAATGLWLASQSVMTEPFTFATVIGASAIYIPAIVIMIALAVVVIGIVPKAGSLIWLYIVYAFITLYLGSLFQIPEWATRLSPYGWVPEWPTVAMDWTAEIGLLVVAILLGAVGVAGYRKRDIG